MAERSEVDGVPVLWVQGPEPLSAGLVFRVGRRDETLAGGGLTHLVEHLVMGSLPRSHVDRNAVVEPGTTEFTVTGRPEQVAQFLEAVCRGLAEVPVDRLDTERRVLAAEEASSGPSVMSELLLARYGARGLGLLGMGEPGLHAATAEQVRAHAARFFGRGNAALWLTGPPPAGLHLPLADGPRHERPAQPRLDRAYPARRRYPGAFPALGGELPAGEAAEAFARVARERLEQALRHDGGHSYDVDAIGVRVDADVAHLGLFADGTEAEVPAVLRGMHGVLAALAEDGPTAEELAHDLEGFREADADPRSASAKAGAAARDVLAGRAVEMPEERLAASEALSSADLAACGAALLSSALVLLPDGVGDDVLSQYGLQEELSAGALQGREVRRRLRSDAPRGSRLVVGADGVMLRLAGGARVTVRYDDLVGVGVPSADHAHLELVSGEGLTLSVCEQDWRGGAALVAEVAASLADVERFPLAGD